jgi:hypothetical protein
MTEDKHPNDVVFWHRELPPLTVEAIGEHTVEANSARIAGTIAHHDELWSRCYAELMAAADARVRQEVVRLGGSLAHVHGEEIVPKRDARTNEAWLHGRFIFTLYRDNGPGPVRVRPAADRRRS